MCRAYIQKKRDVICFCFKLKTDAPPIVCPEKPLVTLSCMCGCIPLKFAHFTFNRASLLRFASVKLKLYFFFVFFFVIIIRRRRLFKTKTEKIFFFCFVKSSLSNKSMIKEKIKFLKLRI